MGRSNAHCRVKRNICRSFLFVAYLRAENTGKRENKYQSVIEGLTRSLSALKQVQSDVKDVESVLREVASHVGIKEENHESVKKVEVVVDKEKA